MEELETSVGCEDFNILNYSYSGTQGVAFEFNFSSSCPEDSCLCNNIEVCEWSSEEYDPNGYCGGGPGFGGEYIVLSGDNCMCPEDNCGPCGSASSSVYCVYEDGGGRKK
jgi:hypothetical protein